MLIVICFLKISIVQSNTKLQSEASEKVSEVDSNIISLYCWEIKEFNLSKLKDEVEYLNVNTLYIQRPANDTEYDRLKQIMEFAKQYKLDVFLLEGARDWLTTGNIENVTNLIDEAYKLNQILDYKLKGVSLDVEFYLTDDYQNAEYDRQLELFRVFTENTKKCCDYANSKELGYSMALPVWLNKLSEEVLEELMNYNYDHIAFMNYFKETIMDNMNEEVEIARKHNIKIVSIAEVQDSRFGTVGEEDTFYYDGLENCINTLNEIKQKYKYENLGISYHYYKPLLDLLERDTSVGIENRYEIQVYPYINGESIKVDEIVISDDEVTPKIIHGYNSKSKEYNISVYALEYGKEYTLTAKSGDFIASKTVTYQKDDDNIDELEIVRMNIELKEQFEETNPDEKEPDTTIPEEGENKPGEKNPETTNPGGEESKPGEKDQNQTNLGKDESKPNKENGKDETMAPSTLPQTGEGYFINNFPIICMIICVTYISALIVINKVIIKNK